MTRGTGERLYRACRRCRARKSKCDLNSVGELGRPPCLECFRTGHDCTLAGSRRGGDYTHLRKRRSGTRQVVDTSTRLGVPVSLNPPSTDRQVTVTSGDEPLDCNQDEEPMCVELKNPFDALQILAKAAVNDSEPSYDSISSNENAVGRYHRGLHDCVAVSDNPEAFTVDSGENDTAVPGINDYELIRNGALLPETVLQLLQHYLVNYHPFVPLVPQYVFSPLNIDEVTVKEPFLLTAILTIASKDDPKWDGLHQQCWKYMKQLLLDVLLGLPSTQQVGSVEGLLLLSDWVPYIQFDRTPNAGISRGKISVTEDSTAWSLVGQAVRQAYLLRLDRTSFREDIPGESTEQIDRKRLVWTFVYLADRQISVRMGQSFWSRGPSLSTRFTASDFPTLQPGSNAEDDYASVLQATIELTQLLHNVHDILYSSKIRTMEMMRMGDYSRYLDDFLKALTAWYQQWGRLKLSPKLKSSLHLMYEYLCLYVNAFSFQSILTRASTGPNLVSTTTVRNQQNPTFFPRGVMASPDGRFVFEAIRAAKMVLKVVIEMDAANELRYMPSRFYLYGIYSAVFLNRAYMFGALTMKEEHNEIVKLVRGFMSALEVAATGEHHIGLRYSRLLKNLWFPGLVRKRVEIQQQVLSPANFYDDPASCQVPAKDVAGFPESIIPETSYNFNPDILTPTWAEESGFDPFCGSFSYFETDVFGMLSQSDVDSGISKVN